jgi:hypothetical protein
MNKFDYLYVLQGQYGHGWEDLAAEDQTPQGWKAIKQTRKEYRENEGGTYRIIKRRELAKL